MRVASGRAESSANGLRDPGDIRSRAGRKNAVNASGAISMTSGDDVDVHMWDRLAGRVTVVDADGGAVGAYGTANHSADPSYQREEFGGL